MNWYHRLLNIFHRDQVEADIEQEFEFHLAQSVEKLIASGMSPEEARRTARRQFGNYTLHKESARNIVLPLVIGDLGRDVRYGARQLRRNPGFTLVAVLALGIGMGANITIFEFVSALLLRPAIGPGGEPVAAHTAAPCREPVALRGGRNPGTVQQRRREIGIRMALGASPWGVMKLITNQGMIWTGAELMLGLLGGLGATLLLRGLLYGVSVADPFAFIVTPLILGGSAYLACYFPARRASRLDSLSLLRDE